MNIHAKTNSITANKRVEPCLAVKQLDQADELKGYKYHIRTDHGGKRILICSSETVKYAFLIHTVGIDGNGRVAYLSTMTSSPLDRSNELFQSKKDSVKTKIIPKKSNPWQLETHNTYFTYFTVDTKKCGEAKASAFSWMRGLALKMLQELDGHDNT